VLPATVLLAVAVATIAAVVAALVSLPLIRSNAEAVATAELARLADLTATALRVDPRGTYVLPPRVAGVLEAEQVTAYVVGPGAADLPEGVTPAEVDAVTTGQGVEVRADTADGAVLVGMAYVFLPLMVLPLYAAMDRLDFRLVEAGYDLYASRLSVLWHVILPQVRPGLVAGSILVFIPAIGSYVTPRVLGGGKTMMLGNLIGLQFGQGRNWPLGAALSMLLLVIVLAALAIYLRATSDQKGGRDRG
jgi:ABC-type Fe3+ transport system permease subunit